VNFEVAGPGGFEPLAYGLGVCCSMNTLSLLEAYRLPARSLLRWWRTRAV